MKVLAICLITASVAGAGWWWGFGDSSAGTVLKEGTVERDTLVVSLAATGTLEPEEVIDVGAQVAGMVREFGKDTASGKEIDYGSTVEPDTVLARIDDSLYKEEVQLAKAELAQVKAKQTQAELAVAQSESNLKRAEADLGLAETRSKQAIRDRTRIENLRTRGTASISELETSQSNAEQMAAQVTIAEAALAQAKSTLESSKAAVPDAKAAVERSEALLRKAEANFSYTTIRSPIHGVIVDRRVNIGQTVVASLNAPSLFLIAKDLQKLEIWASVNEADIGQIREGQKVKFNVDAHPEDTFQGVVSQIRLNATMTQNVVTYTVVVTVDNNDGRLIPYLTANLKFEVDKRKDVLVVPTAALRWQPRPEQIHPEDRPAPSEGNGESRGERGASGGGGGPLPGGNAEGGRGEGGRPGGRGKPKGTANPREGTLWVADGDFVRPVKVKTGATDGPRTEVSGEGVKEGLQVVMGETKKTAKSGETVNPFQPQFFNRRGTRSGGG